MLLPETVLLAGLVVFGGTLADHYHTQQALAGPFGVLQDGVSGAAVQDAIQARPAALLTYNGNDIVKAFHYSDLKRQDGAMTVLQFRGRQCILDLYMKHDTPTPVSYEFRPRQTAKLSAAPVDRNVDPKQCIDDILKHHHI